MRYYLQLEEKLPFTIILILTILMAIFIVLTHYPSSVEYLLILRRSMQICCVIILVLSIKHKRYIHSIFFIFLLVTTFCFNKTGHFGQAKNFYFIFFWDLLNIVDLLIFIYFCYSYYPKKR
jgi:hypothetical protein